MRDWATLNCLPLYFRFHNMEHEHAKMGKDLGYLKKNYQKTKMNLEKEEEKSKNLENKITELEEIINLMKEIVFSDSDEHSALVILLYIGLL